MRLKVLMDNNAVIDQYYLAEPGLSFLLEDGETRLLFDTGYSGTFLANADAMGEDLSSVDAIIISHGHDDHSAGLGYWLDRFGADNNLHPGVASHQHTGKPADSTNHKPVLVAHPQAFNPKRKGELNIGSSQGLEELSHYFTLHLSKDPQEITPRFVFLGEIPRTNPFEGLEPIGETTLQTGLNSGSAPAIPPDIHSAAAPATANLAAALPEPTWVPDKLPDDSALVWKGDDGLVIIAGCSHAGIVNIVEYAVKICGDTRISDIIGGFHLLDAPSARLDFTRERLTALAPRTMHPCHCTDLAARIYLAAALPVKELGVGMEFHYH